MDPTRTFAQEWGAGTEKAASTLPKPPRVCPPAMNEILNLSIAMEVPRGKAFDTLLSFGVRVKHQRHKMIGNDLLFFNIMTFSFLQKEMTHITY